MIRTRRTGAGMPDSVRHEKWRLALDMLDELAGLGAGTAGGGRRRRLRRQRPVPGRARRRGRVYVMQVDGELTAHAGDAVPEIKPYTRRGRRPRPRYRSRPVGLRAHALAAGRAAAVERTWRNGSRDR